jgi:hypothetical protein
MTTFTFRNKKYGPIPDSYNELSGKQLIALMKMFERKLEVEVAKLEALRILLGMSTFWFVLLSADSKNRMLPYVEWVFDKNTLTKQLIHFYNGFIGPKKEFDNLTVAEFHFAEIFYRELVHEKNEAALDKLVAVLYRNPKLKYNHKVDSDGDARIRFNANEVDYYSSEYISHWRKEVKLAILMFYDGNRQYLLELYDDVFQGDKGEENSDGMFGIIRGLSGEKYGDIDKVERLNIHTALNEISLQIKEAEELKRQYKN